jgi:hypothetical protein
LPPELVNDPALVSLVNDAKRFNLGKLELKFESARKDAIGARLKLEGLKAKPHPNAAKIQRAQDAYNSKMIHVRAAGDAYSEGLTAYQRVETFLTGKAIVMYRGEQALDRRGYPIFNTATGVPIFLGEVQTTTYVLKGHRDGFNTPGEAAFDAHAMGRAVGAAIGNYDETPVYIVKRPDGNYSYDYNYKVGYREYEGTSFRKRFSYGTGLESQLDNPSRALFGSDVVVGILHPHPVGPSLQLNVFLTNPRDIIAGNQVLNSIDQYNRVHFENEPLNVDSEFFIYIGGSDGGVRAISLSDPAILDRRGKFKPSSVRPENYRKIGLGNIRLIKP